MAATTRTSLGCNDAQSAGGIQRRKLVKWNAARRGCGGVVAAGPSDGSRSARVTTLGRTYHRELPSADWMTTSSP
jgi:hypothetical protein